MATAYTDKTTVQNYTLKNIDNSFDTQLNEWILAMSEYCDTLAGYPIYRDTPDTHIYDGGGKCALMIDPVHTITEVLVDTVAPDAAALVKWPYNTDIKTQLVLRSGIFTDDFANVSVTGVHCLKKVLPDQVKWACTVFVSGLVAQSDNQTEGVLQEVIGEYRVTYRTQEERADFIRAREIITNLRRITF